MLNTTECPNEGEESSFVADLDGGSSREILFEQKACQGILQRAARKEKEIPEPLKKALIKQSV
ncbi:MAG: hypothetical protein ACLTA5_06450 [Anaerococcus obesiensis]